MEVVHKVNTTPTPANEVDIVELYNLAVVGTRSKNGVIYPQNVLQDAVGLYVNAPVYIDHSDKEVLAKKVGWIIKAWWDHNLGQIRADIAIVRSHPLANVILWAYEKKPDYCGLSHDVEAEVEESNGIKIVKKIVKVNSVDFVSNPATTTSLVESYNRKKQKMKVNLKEESNMRESLKNLLSSLIDAALSGKIDPNELVKKLKTALELAKGLDETDTENIQGEEDEGGDGGEESKVEEEEDEGGDGGDEVEESSDEEGEDEELAEEDDDGSGDGEDSEELEEEEDEGGSDKEEDENVKEAYKKNKYKNCKRCKESYNKGKAGKQVNIYKYILKESAKRGIVLRPDQIYLLSKLNDTNDVDKMMKYFVNNNRPKTANRVLKESNKKTPLSEAIEDMERIIRDMRQRKGLTY
jgi:hypothetical protein